MFQMLTYDELNQYYKKQESEIKNKRNDPYIVNYVVQISWNKLSEPEKREKIATELTIRDNIVHYIKWTFDGEDYIWITDNDLSDDSIFEKFTEKF